MAKNKIVVKIKKKRYSKEKKVISSYVLCSLRVRYSACVCFSWIIAGFFRD